MSARLRHLRHRDLDGLARDRLDHLKDALGIDVPPGRFSEYTFTATNATNIITVTGEDNLAVGNPRVVLIGDDLPNGLESGVLYWLSDDATDTYQLHPTKEDAAADTNAVTFTDDGTGTLTLVILE